MKMNSAEMCGDAKRREDVRALGSNGIDYIEVSDNQRTLTVYFLRPVPGSLTKDNVQITGGVRVQNIKAVDLRFCVLDDPEKDDCVKVVVDKPGDFSTYTLRLVELDDQGKPSARPFAGLDPLCAQLEFTFKAETSANLDCKQAPVCPPQEFPTPEINYLAKDYATFRQLILDRLAVTMPNWKESHVPDIGIALVEVLAYTADYLSYYQDAVATEAYLNTARQRISVRRHARLVDYAIHEGCNARTWVQLTVKSDVADPPPIDPHSFYFLTGVDRLQASSGAMFAPADIVGIPASQFEVFRPLASASIRLYRAHNQISFYTWRNRLCCLPAGSTSATLRDEWTSPVASEADVAGPPPKTPKKKEKSASVQPSSTAAASSPGPASPKTRARKLQLQPGDVLLFEEVIGPGTGSPADADPAHRHFVRLTSVNADVDPLDDQPVVEIGWAPEDALPFAVCLSVIGPAPACACLPDISVAHGNILLADHGDSIGDASWIYDEPLGKVPRASVANHCQGIGRPAETTVSAGAFRPALQKSPLTYRQPPEETAAAASALVQDPRLAVPQILLRSVAPMLDGCGPLFQFRDLKDPAALAARLVNASDASSRYLRGHLSSATLSLLAKFDPAAALDPALAAAIIADLEPFVRSWIPQRDLFSSSGRDFHYVVEIDDDGRAHLRFGDGELGRAPEAGETFSVDYRVGVGPAGNVGAETIAHIVISGGPPGGIPLTPRNPVAAAGGAPPESIDEIKLLAPGAFQTNLQRAITADDYATLAALNPKVQRAAADLRWTGSGYEAHVAIDPLGTEQVDPSLLDQIRGFLHRYRRVGHDVVVVSPQYIPLDIAMAANVQPDYIREHVETALLDVFSARVLPGGGRGLFHPDNLSFGDSIYLSQLVAAAQAVTGVQSITVTKLQRLFCGPNHEIENGILPIGPLEVARLDNDPVFPENGAFHLSVRGGR
jgi:hypothetical protein